MYSLFAPTINTYSGGFNIHIIFFSPLFLLWLLLPVKRSIYEAAVTPELFHIVKLFCCSYCIYIWNIFLLYEENTIAAFYLSMYVGQVLLLYVVC